MTTKPAEVDNTTVREMLRDLQLAPNGLGNDPLERFPWGSRWVRRDDGRGIVIDDEPFQFLEDADGFPIVTMNGRLLRFNQERLEISEIM